jgi:hypothetical protein
VRRHDACQSVTCVAIDVETLGVGLACVMLFGVGTPVSCRRSALRRPSNRSHDARSRLAQRRCACLVAGLGLLVCVSSLAVRFTDTGLLLVASLHCLRFGLLRQILPLSDVRRRVAYYHQAPRLSTSRRSVFKRCTHQRTYAQSYDWRCDALRHDNWRSDVMRPDSILHNARRPFVTTTL